MVLNSLSRRNKIFVYLTHFFTTLGARMWWFGIGLFIIEVTPDSLQLTAIYGFSNGGALLLLSTVVGDIIDRTARLKAARIALFLNNFGIALCCVIVVFVFTFRPELETKLPEQGLLKLCFTLIVILTIFSNLCNLGRTLVMERDWIVEICNRKTDSIATMSATFRFIDLFTKAFAPLLTGQLMTYVSSMYGAVFIGSWNICAFFIEYWLLGMVYRMNPTLHSKDSTKYELDVIQKEDLMKPSIVHLEKEASSQEKQLNESSVESVPRTDQNQYESTQKSVKSRDVDKPDSSFVGKLFFSFIALYRGWRHYIKYKVAVAGLALAFLYFTVLGFDNITIGYAYSQGMTESILGIIVAISACFGIIASVAYPFLRKHVGLVNTGLIGLTCQISCLALCVVSLWLPGGTFGPASDVQMSHVNVSCTTQQYINTSLSANETSCFDSIADKGFAGMSTSLIVLFAGILGARFGVWTADLVITQLFLESVEETERGLVNGFQSSLNKLMDMLKFVMVMFISDPSMFGYPALVSYCFICSAWLLYAVYKKRTIGNIFCKGCL
ncbi:SLC40A1 [Mytilus coruscus]|uniref:Solute carrier family 40 member n=1 Tax=Mytilus coruscus TaxID=42192 RepID=A0A6J8CR84_MYTCO|nr:SLC40A1 [Mytilus coruscus]